MFIQLPDFTQGKAEQIFKCDAEIIIKKKENKKKNKTTHFRHNNLLNPLLYRE